MENRLMTCNVHGTHIESIHYNSDYECEDLQVVEAHFHHVEQCSFVCDCEACNCWRPPFDQSRTKHVI